jgi:hypothetical protein
MAKLVKYIPSNFYYYLELFIFLGFPDKRLQIPSPQYRTPPNATMTPVLKNSSNLATVSHCRALCSPDLPALLSSRSQVRTRSIGGATPAGQAKNQRYVLITSFTVRNEHMVYSINSIVITHIDENNLVIGND